ncbi:MAG TPA: SigE family RNA polymerase sigma factor [Nocardioides sp.]|uniref:SigE family RNA polymerase sigma factor n=1 Tax=Nocardioides sp. TaxID=35761 RepID=UPI002F40E249
MARRDAGEFTSFVLSSQPGLRRTAYLMCGDWSLASDFVQEALIRVYRHWPRLRGDAEARAYARKAVVSVVIDAKRRRSSTEVPVDEIHDTGGPDDADRSADRELLTRCLAQVPARQRACLVLRYYDDLSVSEVAAVLGISEGTVKSQTARGLETLQAAFARETNDELLVSGRE